MEVQSSGHMAGIDAKASLGAADTSNGMQGISLVLPAYNEQEVISQAVCEADAALSALVSDYEIVVVDDGSTDATAQILAELGDQFARLRVLRQPKNLGYGAALRRGFEAATKGFVCFTDADCQFDLSELERLVFLARDYDIVCGYRIERQDPFLRCFYSNVYNIFVRALLGTRVRDCDCALKLFRRETLHLLPIATDGFLVNGEMLTHARQQDLSVVEVGVTHRPRAAGTSKVSIFHIPVILAALIRFWWITVLFPTRAVPQDLQKWSPARRWRMGLLLMGLASVVLFTNLSYSLFEPDETRYAQIGMEMLETGDWVVPRLDGEPYLDKPPLLYWMTALSYTLFGFNEQSARLPMALSAWLTILSVFILGRRLVGDWAAWIGALLLLLSSGFIISGRFLMMDGPLTLFTTIGLLSASVALHVRKGAALAWWLTAGVACGLGVLTKGPIAPVLSLPPILVAAWMTKNSRPIRWPVVLAVTLPMMLLAGPWFYLISTSQQEFSSHFFWVHHIQRFLSPFKHSESWWFYFPVLTIELLPASLLLLPFVMYLFARGRRFGRGGVNGKPLGNMRTQQLGVLLAAGVWIVFFFSISKCKLPAYILPALPMFCLAMGKMMYDVHWSSHAIPLIQRYTSRALYQAVLLASCVAVVVVIVDLVFNPTGKVGITLAFLLIQGLAWNIWKNVEKMSSSTAWVASAILCFVVAFYGFDRVIPSIASWRSISQSAATLQHQLGEEVPVVYFGRRPHRSPFSISPGEVAEFEADQIDGFRQYMARHAVAVVVIDSPDAERIRDNCGRSIDLQSSATRDHLYVAKSIVSTVAQAGQRKGRKLK
jgi:4-amino-4-deoxy-L-arabinose transferase-like glycosyltransferase